MSELDTTSTTSSTSPRRVKTSIWMPLYIADYLADTSRLTTVQHGAYLLLLMDYWRNGALPNDDSVLAQITKLTPDAWSIARAVIEQFFSVTPATWTHKRVEEEKTKAGIHKELAHARASKGAAARWGKERERTNALSIASSIASSNQQEVLDDCTSPSPSPSPTTSTASTPTPKTKSKDLSPPSASTKQNGTRLPENWALPKAWGEWALGERPDLQANDIRRIAETFKDHWLANANRREGKKADWQAAWRNWIRSQKTQIASTKADQIAKHNEQVAAEFLGSGEKIIEAEVINA